MDLTYVIERSFRHSISVKIAKDCRIMVKAPFGTSESTVLDFLKSKEVWIKKQINKIQNQNACVNELGAFSSTELSQIRKKAKQIIPQRVEYYAKLSGIKYNKIFIRLQKSRWGSCSIEGNLNFNCLLVLMPLEILDSVVIHELCHRRHMNHSKSFYAEIDKYFPNYKACRKWLNENGGVYLQRASVR